VPLQPHCSTCGLVDELQRVGGCLWVGGWGVGGGVVTPRLNLPQRCTQTMMELQHNVLPGVCVCVCMCACVLCLFNTWRKVG
jgi:hypothetical protein